jgi:Ca-activated chloride channel family protein
MKAGTLRQILLITDGCSNHGEPSASQLAKEGITINVIVLWKMMIDEKDLRKSKIAGSGGGVSQKSNPSSCPKPSNGDPKASSNYTGVINRELQQMLGDSRAWKIFRRKTRK